MQSDLKALTQEATLEARKHMGQVAWITVALVVFVIVSYVANLVLFVNGLIPAWVATLIVAALTYMSYTPLHEAVHGNINGRHENYRWLNDLCGYLVAPLIAVPYASHRYEHLTHHKYTNQEDKDPDFVVSGMSKGIISSIVTVFKFLWAQNSFFAKHHWETASFKERFIYCFELAISIGWRVAFLSFFAQSGQTVVILLGYILGGYFTAYWFAYRPHLPYETPKRYLNTNSLIMPKWMKPLEWFWLGQNLHSIHHLYPKVPFYRYHALHSAIEPSLRANGTPIICIFTRRSIPAE